MAQEETVGFVGIPTIITIEDIMGISLIDKLRLLYYLNQLIKEVNNMTNWKTTLFGALTAAGIGMAQVADPIIKAIGQVLSVVGPILLGIFAKDSNVTGGTVKQ